MERYFSLVKSIGFTCFLVMVPTAFAQAGTIEDFARDGSGHIKNHLTANNAANECAKKGMRLPTALEQALEAEKYGGKILEVQKYEAGKIPPGFDKDRFHLIYSYNPDEKWDIFYYSSEHYKRPDGDLGNYWTWSLSLGRYGDGGHKVDFSGRYGVFAEDNVDYGSDYTSARCVSVGQPE